MLHPACVYSKTNCSIKLSDVFVCNFADFFTRFKNGLSAYYSSCSLDVRCRLCSKLCVLLSKMSIQKILIQLCGEIILIYSNWQQNNYVPTTMFRPTVKNMTNIKFTLFFRKLILCSIIIICFEKFHLENKNHWNYVSSSVHQLVGY